MPSSASKTSKSVRLSNAPQNLKHEVVTPPIGANISREFVLATPVSGTKAWTFVSLTSFRKNQSLAMQQTTRLVVPFWAHRSPFSSIKRWISSGYSPARKQDKEAQYSHTRWGACNAHEWASDYSFKPSLGKTVTSIALIKTTLQEMKAADLEKSPELPFRTSVPVKAPPKRPKTTL